jgi:hypothetical protein
MMRLRSQKCSDAQTELLIIMQKDEILQPYSQL